jgi:hypothetical protein
MYVRSWNECRFTDQQRADGAKRLAFLKSVDRKKMSAEQSGRLEYFLTLEQFILEFTETQHQIDLAEQHIKEGNIALAREALAKGDPERIIWTYAKLSRTGHEDQTRQRSAADGQERRHRESRFPLRSAEGDGA